MKKRLAVGSALMFLVVLVTAMLGMMSCAGYADENVKPVKTELLKGADAKPAARMFATGKVLKLTDGELRLERLIKRNGKAFKEVMKFQLRNATAVAAGQHVWVDYVNDGKNNIALSVKHFRQEAK
jgi:hypothetical protein